MKDFSGKTFFITGAANGIGKHLATVFYAKNANVVMADVCTEKMVEFTKDWDDTRYIIVKLDVSNKDNWLESLALCLNKFGRVHFAINAAGIIEPGVITDTDYDCIDRTIDINLKGTIYGSKVFADYFVTKNSGHIINFGSLASLAAVPGLNTYSASKFGVRGFSLAIAQELEDKGVYVSLLCPDAVKTSMLDYQKDKVAAALTFSGTRPLTVDEVAACVLDIIQTKKRETWLPVHRGITAISSSLAPSLAKFLSKMLTQKGIKNQQTW